MHEIPQELHIGTTGDLALPVFIAGVAVALLILLLGWLSRRHYLALPELTTEAVATPPDHCVIIPARNEQHSIGRCVASLQGSLRVVVDDQSSDATVAVAQAAGAEVRAAGPLPPNWLGKSHACWNGVEWTDSDWVVFLDADTWYEPGFLPSLLAYADRHELHAATVFPGRELTRWYERLLVPYALGLCFAGVNPGNVSNARHPEALANGQCFLFRRSAYRFIGGHSAVAGSVVEDIALARLLKRHRMRLAVLRCESMAHARVGRSFEDLWRRFRKHNHYFLRVNPRAGLVALAASVLMTAWLPVLAALLWQEHTGPAVVFALVPAVAWRPWYRSWLQALAAPLAIYLFQALAVAGWFSALLGLSPSWKGRRV